MKNILKTTILFFLLLSNNGYCQHGANWIDVPLEYQNWAEYKDRPWTRFKDLNHTFDRFLGTWEYNQGGHYFKITFFKYENATYNSILHQTEDCVHSYYEYRYNGVLKFETYTTQVSNVSSYFLINEDVLGLFYQEPSLTSCSKARIGDLLLTASYNTNNQPILEWNITSTELIGQTIPCADGSPQDRTDFLVPANMILTKL